MDKACNVNDLLEGHVALDLECLDRLYLNGYVPNLQVGGQVIRFMRDHLGCPVPSPAIFEQIGDRFRAAVRAFALTNKIPLVHFKKGDRHVPEVLLRVHRVGCRVTRSLRPLDPAPPLRSPATTAHV